MDTGSQAGGSTTPVVTLANGRATIRLNRPREHNRLEPDDLAVLRDTFTCIAGDPSIRVLVLTGTGKSFSSGYHIGALVERHGANSSTSPKAQDDGNDNFETAVNALEALRVPTIAALQGSVYGGATDLALACDFRIGVTGMRMLMPAARLGIVYYPSGIERYVSRLGVAAAKRLFLTAEPIEAEEMRRIGYLDEIVPAEELAAAGRCAGGDPRRQCADRARRVEAGDQRNLRRPPRPRRARRGPRPRRRLRRPCRGAQGLVGETQAGVPGAVAPAVIARSPRRRGNPQCARARREIASLRSQ